MRYRVDELATRSGVSVDTIRFYQSKGLVPSPTREGRLAWYSEEHLERVRRVRALKDKGLTLATIRRLLSGELDPPDEALVTALAGPLPGERVSDDERVLTMDELAAETGVSPALLEAIEREGLLQPRIHEGSAHYTASDAAAVKAGLALLEAGLPLSELLALARRHDEAMRGIADEAVEMFVRFVRDPVVDAAGSDEAAAERLVTAFRQMLPATTSLVAHHFRRVLVAAAQARIEGDTGGPDPEFETSP